MKVKHIVSEHKKGVRAHIYNKKATTKAQGPVPLYGPDKHDAKLKPVKVNEEMPGQAIGKVQQVKPDGTVDIQKPSGDTTTVQATALQPGDNNKLTMQTPKIQPGMEVDASKTIEENPEVPYYIDTSSGKPMAKTGGRGMTAIVPSKMWTALTPEIEAKADSQGFRKVMLKWNNQLVPGLEGGDQQLGSKIIVAPSDYQSMSTPGAATMRRPMGVQSAEKTGIGAPSMKESSDDVLLTKMLVIAGIK